jgi:hypothetical protein
MNLAHFITDRLEKVEVTSGPVGRRASYHGNALSDLKRGRVDAQYHTLPDRYTIHIHTRIYERKLKDKNLFLNTDFRRSWEQQYQKSIICLYLRACTL